MARMSMRKTRHWRDAPPALIDEVRACTVCAKSLPAGPRPVVQFGPEARLMIIGQAPGSKVHASGVPWQDDSGDRLRAWTGLSDATFYDPAKVALMPMGFCYPGKGKSGDLPPRRECAPLWHERLLAAMPDCRLFLLVGSYAQAHYIGTGNLTEPVRDSGRDGRAGDVGPVGAGGIEWEEHMMASIFRGGDIVVDTMPEPKPAQNQALVTVLACGICGSDLHAAKHSHRMVAVSRRIPGRIPMDLDRDVVMGHEFCCEVIDYGPKTEKKFKSGTRVCSMPVMFEADGPKGMGYSNTYVGGYAEQMLLAAPLMLEVPNGLPTEHAALTEPLAVGVHAVEKGML